LYLIDVYKQTNYKLVIASNYKNSEVVKEILKHKNISFNSLNDDKDLYNLFQKAHINVLPTFQNTGIKLKLLNTLRQGRFVIANDYMVDKTGLESLCEKANTKAEYLIKTAELFQKDFKSSYMEDREKLLQNFDPIHGAEKIVDTIFKE